MDRLTRFHSESAEVSLSSRAGNTIDNVVDSLKNIERELILKRKAEEEEIYGQQLEDIEGVSEVPPREGD